MSAPKPGDRLRVTFEGTFDGHQDDGRIWVDTRDTATLVPSDATVEVLASPVYVNHDTTEYRVGDIVRGPHGGLYCWSNGEWRGCQSGMPLIGDFDFTLLVRDGQVVQP